MKCKILVSEKMSSIPLSECGGAVLAPGDKLIVKADIYDRMKVQYGPALVCAGEVEKEVLRGGHYEYCSGKQKAPEVSKDALAPAGESSPLTEKSSDKSMIGKGWRKK